MKTTRIVLSTKTVIPNESWWYCHSKRVEHYKDGDSCYVLVNLSTGIIRNPDGSWRIMMDFYHLNPLLTPIAAAVTDEVS